MVFAIKLHIKFNYRLLLLSWTKLLPWHQRVNDCQKLVARFPLEEQKFALKIYSFVNLKTKNKNLARRFGVLHFSASERRISYFHRVKIIFYWWKYRKTTKIHINLGTFFTSGLFIITKRLSWYQGEVVQRQFYPHENKIHFPIINTFM